MRDGPGASIVPVNTVKDYRNIPRKRKRVTKDSIYKPMALTLHNNQLTTDMRITLLTTDLRVDYTGQSFSLLQNLSRGDNPVNQFQGGRIDPKYLRFRWNAIQTHNTQTTGQLRMIIFQWFDSTVPAPSGLLQTLDPRSTLFWDNRPNIQVLYDNYMIAQAQTSPANDYVFFDPKGKQNTVYIKGKKLSPVEFPRSSTIPHRGDLRCLLISDDTVGVTYLNFAAYFEVGFTE